MCVAQVWKSRVIPACSALLLRIWRKHKNVLLLYDRCRDLQMSKVRASCWLRTYSPFIHINFINFITQILRRVCKVGNSMMHMSFYASVWNACTIVAWISGQERMFVTPFLPVWYIVFRSLPDLIPLPNKRPQYIRFSRSIFKLRFIFLLSVLYTLYPTIVCTESVVWITYVSRKCFLFEHRTFFEN